MLSFHSLALAASAIFYIASAIPTEVEARDYKPGTLNNTQEFRISLKVPAGYLDKYNGWQLQAYHTGAGLADPVFTNDTGSRVYLNDTRIQFDVNLFPFSLIADYGDTNNARWEPTSIGAGYGSTGFVISGSSGHGPKVGIVGNYTEFGGWLVCEWYHAVNLPQLFQLIKGFNSAKGVYPNSCSEAELFPIYI